MLTAEQNKEVQIFNAAGTLLKSKADHPDFDPSFLKGFMRGLSNQSIAEAIAKEPYARHAWVYACVKVYTRNLAGLTPVFYKKDDPNELIFNHPWLDLLEHPHPQLTGEEFFETVLLNLLLPTPSTSGGQCFIIPQKFNGDFVNLVAGEMPDILWPFSDLFIRPKIRNYMFEGWEFNPHSGKRLLLQPENVIRIRLINRSSLFQGMSPFSSLAVDVVNDAKASELSDKFLDNNASVGTVITTDQEINPTTLKKLQDQIKEQYAGFQNAGKSMLLHSGFKLDNIGKTLQELEFIKQREFNREQIEAVYGLSKFDLGRDETVNRATAEIREEKLWNETLMPMARKLWNGGFNPEAIRYIDKRDLRGKFDTSNVQALKKNQESKIGRAEKLIQQGVPPNTAYQTVGLDIETDGMDWLDEPLVKGMRVNLDSGEVLGKPAAGTPDGQTPDKTLIVKTVVNAKISKEERDEFWLIYVEKTLTKPEKDYKRFIIKFWTQQRNLFLDKADEWEADNKKFIKEEAAAKLSDFMIPKKPEDIKLIKASDPLYQETINLATIQMTTELGELVNWDPSGPLVDKIKKARAKYLRGINTTTFKTMGKEITTILNENTGVSIHKLTKLIKQAERETFGARIASDAQTVARTETSSVSSNTRNDIMKEEGVEKHQWVTAGDEGVRHSHALEGEGDAVKMGAPFPVTGLLFPLAEGPAAEVINCRCTTVAAK